MNLSWTAVRLDTVALKLTSHFPVLWLTPDLILDVFSDIVRHFLFI